MLTEYVTRPSFVWNESIVVSDLVEELNSFDGPPQVEMFGSFALVNPFSNSTEEAPMLPAECQSETLN